MDLALVDIPWTGVLVVGAVFVAAGLVGRGRTPRGLSAAWFAVGVSVAGLPLLVMRTADLPPPLPLATVLAGWCALWTLVGGWIERPATSSAASHTPEADDRRAVANHIAAVCGALLAGVCLHARGLEQHVRVILTVLLGLCAAGNWLVSVMGASRPRLARRFGTLALLVAGLGVLAPVYQPLLAIAFPSWAAVLTGAAGPILVGALIVSNWRRRVRLWRESPDRLLEPNPSHRIAHGLIVALGLLAATLAVGDSSAGWAPVTLGLAALGVLSVAHRTSWQFADEAGMVLLATCAAALASAWLPDFGGNHLLGGALAGAYLLWLARFWTQQLHGDVAWTTAGRLIQTAARLGCGSAYFLIALATPLLTEPAGLLSPVGAAGAVLVLVLLFSMLMRDGRRRAEGAYGWAAAPVFCIAVGAAAAALAVVDAPIPALYVPAAMALGLAVRAGGEAGAPDAPAMNAYIGAFLPAGTIVALLAGVTFTWTIFDVAVTGLLLAGIIQLRGGTWRWSGSPHQPDSARSGP